MIHFDVVVLTYNRPVLLKRTLQSLSLQTYRQFTVHLIDNGSTPPVDVSTLPGDLQIRFRRFDVNDREAGESALRDLTGNYVLFLADDDVLVPSALEIVAAVLDHGIPIDLLGTAFSRFDHDCSRPKGALSDLQSTQGRLTRIPATQEAVGHCEYWGVGRRISLPRPCFSHPSSTYLSREVIERTLLQQKSLLVKPLGDVGFLGCCFHTDYSYHLELPLTVIGQTSVRELSGALPGRRAYWRSEQSSLRHTPLRGASFTNIGMESHLAVLRLNGIDKAWDCSLRPDFFLRHLEQVASDDPWTDETIRDIHEALPFAVEGLSRQRGLVSEADREALENELLTDLQQYAQKARLQRTPLSVDGAAVSPDFPRFSDIVDFAVWQDKHIVRSHSHAWVDDHRSMPMNQHLPKEQPLHIPISFQVCVYNEESRIRNVLEHAIRWADEVIVVNKSSTDRTRDICLEYGTKVRVVDIPFSPQSHEDAVELSRLATNDWIFFGTASEMPTRGLIKEIRDLLFLTRGSLDLVYVPRKMYSFGIHSPHSPWSVSYYPFLVNRKKAVITNTIHANYLPRDPQNAGKIEYSKDCCVYHLTHTTAKGYMRAMSEYFEAEAAGCTDPEAKLRECFANIAKFEEQLRNGGKELQGHYFAWPIYWLGTALFVWEKQMGRDVSKYYTRLREEVLRREWLQEDGSPAANTDSLRLLPAGQAAPSTTSSPVSPEPDEQYLVTAVVSAYKSERFMRGCLEDLEAQTIADQLEIVVVDSGSPQNERAIVEEFQQRYGNIVYIRTESREGVYSAWNRGIKAARGKYITNANTDDRHRMDYVERMMKVLEANPDVALAYANCYITEVENETFDKCTLTGIYRWHDFDPFLLTQGCFMGPQPMWRKSVHDRYGYFDESYESAGDWEFWLRIAETETFNHVDEFLGLYLKSPTSVEHRNHELSVREARRVIEKYLARATRLKELRKDDTGTPDGTMDRRVTAPLEKVRALIVEDAERPRLFASSLAASLSEQIDITLISDASAEGASIPEKLALPDGWQTTTSSESVVVALNRALGASGDRPVVLLSSDLVLTAGWLDRLTESFDRDPKLAAVAPLSNQAPKPHRITPKYGNTGKELRRFAGHRAKQHRGDVKQVPYLGAFCIALNPRICREVGLLREEFDLPTSLWDLFARLGAADYKLGAALDCYVHHEKLTIEEGSGFDDLASTQEEINRRIAAGNAALGSGDAASAVNEFAALTREFPELALGHSALGSALVAAERPQEAAEAFRQALALTPQDAALHNQLGVALYQVNDAAGAEEAFLAACKADSSDVQASLNLIDLYRSQERYVEATQSVKEAMQIVPDHPEVLVAFATLSLELGDLEAGRMALDRLQTASPEHPATRVIRQALEEIENSQPAEEEALALGSL